MNKRLISMVVALVVVPVLFTGCLASNKKVEPAKADTPVTAEVKDAKVHHEWVTK